MLKVKFDTSQFNKDLQEFTKHVESSLDLTTKEVAEEIKTQTLSGDSSIPVIAGSTSVIKLQKGYEVNKGGNLPHPELAAYSEFGTGNFAGALLSNYPTEWKDMAREYYVNGKGRLPATPSLYNAFVRQTTNIADKAADKING